MPDARHLFFHKRNMLPIQEAAIPHILKGKNVLLSSPTASGKTVAVVAPLYQRHVSFKRHRVSVIYIAPTKALVNDIYFRLIDYLETGGQGKKVFRYTGDHHDFKDPEKGFIIATTPEALDSLQLTKPKLLEGVRTVIIDEIHFLHGTARGEQLRYVLKRIKAASTKPPDIRDNFQLVGTSATINDIEEVKNLWLGEDAVISRYKKNREIGTEIMELSETEKEQAAKKAASSIYDWVLGNKLNKILTFANSRNEAHLLALSLYELFKEKGYPVYLHMGILSQSERDRIETDFKKGRRGICVATSTLEVGIDIGDIEATVLYRPPFSVNSFLQRIGRGNRKTDRCRVLLLSKNQKETIVFNAILELAKKGDLEPVHEYDRYSVAFQQALSQAWRATSLDEPFSASLMSTKYGGEDFIELIQDMLETKALSDIQGALVPSDRLMDLGNARQIHTNISAPAGREVIDAKTGEKLAEFTPGFKEGGLFIGSSYRELLLSEGHDIIVDTKKKGDKKAVLPSARFKRGLPRKIVWKIVEIEGQRPALWTRDGDRLKTWGGQANNTLLQCVLTKMADISLIPVDAFGIDGIPGSMEVCPEMVLDILQDRKESLLTVKEAKQFLQPSRFFSYLGKSLQKKEIMASVPWDEFEEWLMDCIKGAASRMYF